MNKRTVLKILTTLSAIVILLLNTYAKNPVSPTLATVAESTQISYEIVKVIDGDTISVIIDGVVEKVRLLGINTPETVDPRKTVECFGKEASDKTKSILTSQKITLEADASQGDRDKYGRLLRYIYLEDETFVNLFLIQEGYAYEYTYNKPYKYQVEFKQAQKEAEINERGLWGNLCNN